MSAHAAIFENHRPVLTGIAYRMLGTCTDAQDIVQETYLKWSQTDLQAVREPRAWLVTTCSRLALNALQSARLRRENYVGAWLPEPLVDNNTPGPADTAQIDETVSVALLLALEKLSPPERAAFLLHEVFDYSFDEIAGILGKSSAACRKLASRARLQVKVGRPRFPTAPDEHLALLSAFLTAARGGDIDGLKRLLADDVALHSDGGGKRSAVPEVLHGVDVVAAMMTAIWKRQAALGQSVRVVPGRFNGAPGLLIYEDGRLTTALAAHTESGRIQAIYAVRNPDKLTGLPQTPPP